MNVPKLLIACVVLVASAGQVQAGVFVPPGLGPGDTYHVVFTTAEARNAWSTDIEVFNAFVQSQAELSGALTENWGVDWFAVGSTETVDARDNAVVSAPVYRLDGIQVATGFADFWDGTMTWPLGVTQIGSGLESWVFTGTEGNGTAHPVWELGAQGSQVLIGRSDSTGGWNDDQTTVLSNQLPFYALSEVLTVVPEPTFFSIWSIGLVGITCVGGRRKRGSES